MATHEYGHIIPLATGVATEGISQHEKHHGDYSSVANGDHHATNGALSRRAERRTNRQTILSRLLWKTETGPNLRPLLFHAELVASRLCGVSPLLI